MNCRFQTRNELFLHVQLCHFEYYFEHFVKEEPEPKYQNVFQLSCHICGMGFCNSKPTLYNHIRNEHEEYVKVIQNKWSKNFGPKSIMYISTLPTQWIDYFNYYCLGAFLSFLIIFLAFLYFSCIDYILRFSFVLLFSSSKFFALFTNQLTINQWISQVNLFFV